MVDPRGIFFIDIPDREAAHREKLERFPSSFTFSPRRDVKDYDRRIGLGLSLGAGLGVTFGVVLGVILDNVGLGIALGISLGVGLGTAFGAVTNEIRK